MCRARIDEDRIKHADLENAVLFAYTITNIYLHGSVEVDKIYLSYNVAVIQWKTSCHKNRITTRVITLWRVLVTLLSMSVSTMCFLIDIMFI